MVSSLELAVDQDALEEKYTLQSALTAGYNAQCCCRCRHCGRRDVTVESYPTSTGPLVRPSSHHTPIPVQQKANRLQRLLHFTSVVGV